MAARGIEMLAWAAQRPIVYQPDLVEVIRDGFSPAKDGEDPFDAVVGLFLMLDVVLG